MNSKSLFLISALLAAAAAQQQCSADHSGSLAGVPIQFNDISVSGGSVKLAYPDPCRQLGQDTVLSGLSVKACVNYVLPSVDVPDLQHAIVSSPYGALVSGTAYCRLIESA